MNSWQISLGMVKNPCPELPGETQGYLAASHVSKKLLVSSQTLAGEVLGSIVCLPTHVKTSSIRFTGL